MRCQGWQVTVNVKSATRNMEQLIGATDLTESEYSCMFVGTNIPTHSHHGNESVCPICTQLGHETAIG